MNAHFAKALQNQSGNAFANFNFGTGFDPDAFEGLENEDDNKQITMEEPPQKVAKSQSEPVGGGKKSKKNKKSKAVQENVNLMTILDKLPEKKEPIKKQQSVVTPVVNCSHLDFLD